MIKEHIARAQMISMMGGDQISKLHEIENRIGHTLANWNIEEYFHLPAIRDRYGIPEDPELMAMHNHRIEQEIESKHLLATEPYEEKLEQTHMRDFNIFHAKDQIIWDYQGRSGRSNIKDMLRGSFTLLGLALGIR